MSRADEEIIRQCMAPWLDAVRAGATEQVLPRMPDDVVILLPGEPPMRKPEFERLIQPMGSAPAVHINGFGDILELKIIGAWAFVWTRLHVMVRDKSGASAPRTGHTLTIFHKEGDQWVPAPDAQMPGPYQNN